ncbi:Exodeoxyribonuclease VII large subunit [Pricia antarctica]|uniref:Exodeoxyribonuclease 7 large subunit n=1 Tax=Pricia antarctica TaxID=641691 RepID=A0A1G6ZZL4_9FLAO|nr:exodeoxyribonuclease VII large subunit [Pricia antarctica]SDE07086.1 Exodeoxyribonuclease VII large subunit [Pricia antarctica]
MSEKVNGKHIFSLLEVTKSIQKTITNRYQTAFWVKAEMNKLNHYQRSGHCYPELVEKKEGKVIAQISAILWKSDYQKINTNFQRVLKEPLKDGIKILFSATINFDPKYGLTLQINDIDPSFTLGDLEKEKQDTINKLRLAGIFSKNKQLALPVLPQRIAIISVETSKGYADFLNVFESAGRSWNYTFFQLLFPSLLQGDNAVRTIIAQLRRIKKVIHHFDVVAIVRGGGGDIGLSCYNNYDLAKEIAEFPIPVITGIGHSTNETVAELIAHENAITPTKLAEFLIQKFHDFSVPVHKAEEKIIDRSRSLIRDAQTKFASEVKLLRSVTRNILDKNKNAVRQQAQSLSQQSRFRLGNEKKVLTAAGEDIRKGTYQFCTAQKHHTSYLTADLKKAIHRQLAQKSLGLKNLETNIHNLSPQNVLKRGYSITQLAGKAIRSTEQVNPGDLLTTVLYEGSVSSTVQSTKKA